MSRSRLFGRELSPSDIRKEYILWFCELSCYGSALSRALVSAKLASQFDSASESPMKAPSPLYSEENLVRAWADLLFSKFTAVKRESKDESERYLLGFASLKDVYRFFLQDSGRISDAYTRKFYV